MNKNYETYSKSREASAPPIDLKISGYENLGFGNLEAQLEQTTSLVNIQPYNRGVFKETSIINENEAREALSSYVSSRCCYGKKPLKEMSISNISSSNTLRYLLKTYTEARVTKWASVPYRGEPVFNTGIPPQPWDILVQPKCLFQKEIVEVEIPNTAGVRQCDTCTGAGTCACVHCGFRGYTPCGQCRGTGKTCVSCGNRGYLPCHTCNSTGRCLCTRCQGSGNLKWFIMLIVTFDTIVEDFFKGQESVPVERMRDCVADIIFNEQATRVYPLNNFSDIQINMVSQQLIQSHLGKYPNRRVLMQMHELTSIPVTQCKYVFKEKEYTFYVYGLNRCVHEKDYPHNCCGCCFCLIV